MTSQFKYWLTLILSILCLNLSHGQSESELKSKSQNISRFARYITWPSSALGRDFVIGVVGEDRIVASLKQDLERGEAQGKPIKVVAIKNLEDIDKTPILFVSNSSRMVFSGIVRKTLNKPILLITEKEGRAKKDGSDINFVYPVDNWRFEIVTEQIRNKGLSVPEKIVRAAFKEIPLVDGPEVVYVGGGEPEVITKEVYIEDPEAAKKLARLQEQLQARYDTVFADLSPEERERLRAQMDSLQEKYDKADLARRQLSLQQQVATQQKEIEDEKAATEAEKRKSQQAWQRVQLGIITAVALLLLVLALLFYNFSQRRKKVIEELRVTQNELSTKAVELNKQNDLLEESARMMDVKNKEINEKNEQLTGKTEELEEQNRKITDSIRYANTIQQALLPSEERLQELFADHFILYEPKDIVSGDFYWVNKFEEKTLVAAVDCTGHGVPGAFMSTIGIDLLNEIVNERREYSPNNILEYLHHGIYERLRQGDTNNRDGMDVCLCLIRPANDNQFLVTFSGAKRPLYYVQDNELKRIGGDSKYIGGIKKEKQNFQNHDLILKKGDILYLTTDGYADTPNPKRRKFGSMRFQEMLNLHREKSLELQKEIFSSELNEHRQDTPSRDDITLMAIQL